MWRRQHIADAFKRNELWHRAGDVWSFYNYCSKAWEPTAYHWALANNEWYFWDDSKQAKQDMIEFQHGNLGLKKHEYRWHWLPEPQPEHEDDLGCLETIHETGASSSTEPC